ncbi:MAG: 1-(5-phosphoribosyl)-5-(5-phosphoribosylamino)methylideneamino imidazole-4-carboxamide isomerase [Gemmatimonadetes bacterium]|jgi:phosphoribosylformimino-5-aminoimidazole carboxamide ribotide isomerase|nr:1-(5-phosphoribosyl)-5-(5-phosphoribosylamino)methylideneamino imidazole-4-carboxamide isomerase [Gemmatimonadota bacterium]
MIAIPAVDLRGGACVQLVGGSYAQEKVRLENPLEVARSWERYGFERLHVVDLDAATGQGSNLALVRTLIADAGLPVQVGGGVRSSELVEELLEAGAMRVIVGTRAIEEPDWLADLASRHPGEIIVAADVRERRVTTRGWAHTMPVDILDLVEELNGFPLGGLLVTAVHREGQLQGTDLPLMEDVAELSNVPVIASGGISSMQDLRALEHRGLAGAVIGMALYTGALDPVVVAGEFRE